MYDATKTKLDLGRTNERIREVEHSLDRVLLLSQALWELISPHLELTEADLVAKMDEIRHRDTIQDQYAPPACRTCSRPLGTNAARCLYCGTSVPKSTVFE